MESARQRRNRRRKRRAARLATKARHIIEQGLVRVPNDSRASVRWKVVHRAVILNPEWMVHIEE